MLKFVCDICKKPTDDWKGHRRIVVLQAKHAPITDAFLKEKFAFKNAFDLCKKCYEELGLE